MPLCCQISPEAKSDFTFKQLNLEVVFFLIFFNIVGKLILWIEHLYSYTKNVNQCTNKLNYVNVPWFLLHSADRCEENFNNWLRAFIVAGEYFRSNTTVYVKQPTVFHHFPKTSHLVITDLHQKSPVYKLMMKLSKMLKIIFLLSNMLIIINAKHQEWWNTITHQLLTPKNSHQMP